MFVSLRIAASEVPIYDITCVHLSGITAFVNVTGVRLLFHIKMNKHSKEMCPPHNTV